jgi:GMP synthase (glutamine-hydrolysing)
MTTAESGSGGRPRVLVVQHESDAPPLRLATAAEAAGLRLDVVAVDRGEALPQDLDGVEGLVVLGGSMDVADAPGLPYLYETMELIRRAADEGRPSLGICLGGQLAATALGGEARRGETGVEIGWVEVRTTPAGRADPVTAPLGDTAPLFQWHHDVFAPPAGATLLLTADRYRHQGFRLGVAWGIQAHPEVTADAIRLWAGSPGGLTDLRRVGQTERDLLERAEERGEAGQRMLEAWCGLVAERAKATSRG